MIPFDTWDMQSMRENNFFDKIIFIFKCFFRAPFNFFKNAFFPKSLLEYW